MKHPEEDLRMAAQRRAVLAERLLIDLEGTTSAATAAAVVAQALVTVGGADEAVVRLRTPDGPQDGPSITLASSTAAHPRGGDEPVTLTDRARGLDLTVTGALVPPVAVSRTLRALRSTLDRIDAQDALLLQARTDGLTGLLNRRAMDERIATEVARTARGGGVLSMMLMDLDGFKQVNDTLGHQAGDMLLKDVAATILGIARSTDDACRLGGDEFAVLLPGTGIDGAVVAAERLCEAVRSLGGAVTASIGVTTVDAADERGPETIMRDADEALYAAKRAGRDRAVHQQQLVIEIGDAGPRSS